MSLKYYDPQYFLPQELVPDDVYAALGDRSLLTMDYRILKTIDAIRDFFGKPVWINTWKFQANGRKHSGYRPPSDSVGAPWSQHRFGRACDLLIDDVPAGEARRCIMEAEKHFPYITVIEDKVSWVHVDCRAVVGQGIQLILP